MSLPFFYESSYHGDAEKSESPAANLRELEKPAADYQRRSLLQLT